MKKNGKVNIKQVIMLVVVVLVIGYELLSGGNDSVEETPASSAGQSQEQSEPQSGEQSEELSSDSEELIYSEESQVEESPEEAEASTPSLEEYLSFRNESLWESHYEKHGIDMGFASMEEYLEAANWVLYHEDTLHKTEAEDGDDVYFLEETGEFVVVSTDGYIRTYFIPDDGIDYFNRQ